MDQFLNTHVPLANKNCPIIISLGEYIDDSQFSTQADSDKVKQILHNIQNKDGYRYKIQHTKGITELNYGNYNFKHQKNNVEFNIINTKDTYVGNNLFIRVLDIKKDSYIVPSFNEYNSQQVYDLMTVTVNNYIDVNIYDYQDFYKCDIILKKPVKIDFLKNLIELIAL